MAPDPSLTPELVHARAFTVGFRGYDQSEVRDFLNRISAEIRSLREQVEQLESNWRSAEERAARPPVLDEETLMAAVGQETAAILRTARASAAELRDKAAEDAERVRVEAGKLLADKTKEAEEAAGGIVDRAQGEAGRIVEKAHAEAEQIRAKAEQDRALTIDGANATREKILDDLSRRRRVATVQIEQLRAGRERLLESYAVVRRTLEEAQEELTRADAEARAAADEVGRRMNREGEGHAGLSSGGPAAEGSGAGGAGGEGGAGGASDLSGSGGSGASGGSGGPGIAVAAAEHPSSAGSGEGDPQDSVPHLRVVPDLTTETGTVAAQELEAEVVAAQEAVAGATDRQESAEKPDAAQTGAAGSSGEDESSGDDESPVDQLFARIRAGRGGRSGGAAKAGEGMGGEPEVSKEAGVGEAGPEGTPAEPEAVTAEAERAVTGEAARAATAEAATGGAAQAGQALAASGPPAEAGDEPWLQKREQAISNLEVSLTRKLKRALQDEQNDLLDRLRGMRTEVTAAALLPPANSHKERYTAAALPLVTQAATAGAEFAVTVIGGDAGKIPDVAPIADEAADSIVGPLRRRLEQAIMVGASEDQAVLIESLGAAYREWKSQRVERVSGDALFAAFSSGTWHAVPEGARMRWIVDDVDGPCPDCDDDALAGGLPKGEAFPTGQAHPPAHTGCRCLLVPVKD